MEIFDFLKLKLPIIQAPMAGGFNTPELASLIANSGGVGSFFSPTVITDVEDNAKIMDEEPFGPLLQIDSFKSIDEIIDRANRLDFGLASYAFTNDPKITDNSRSEIQAGLLAVNSNVVSTPETSFGGIKQSGYGSKGGIEGLDAFLVTRFISETYNI